ncbi:hypothetical protein AN963_08830 [Brevibacillus choshinensis]|uniref:Bacterial transcriptional activator domain-containing protein n=1 Tax=Brevibacillus choshinensis TaxID=54911 RepID=A0ABR5NE19_BRECH|nr:tetratricopeptide repeat protein [Brevibacillus choshinensis]KQL49795.1 hypothetical protein AN963_08830 [Brevibacillus choshinensis]
MNIIESKLTIPDFSPYLVRDRLFSLLEKNLERSLICLTGDGGYGKTTLVSSFVKIKDIPTVWYQVGHTDRYPHVFLSYLKAGLSKVMGLEQKDTYVHPELVEEELQQLLSLLSTWPTRLLIVLDDYQWLDQSEEIQEIITKLLFQSARTITYIITSRVRPALPLVKLKLQQNLAELKASDLAFSNEETTLFFNSLHQLHLQEHEIQFIVNRTEGWIASIQLIHDLIKEMTHSERYRFWAHFKGIPDLYDYLGSEVLASQPKEIQSFLYKTSLLAELHVDIVNLFLDEDHTKRMLDHLLDHHLFIYRTEEGTYKYHQLFRMFLYEKLIKQSDRQEIDAYHLKLAHIYEEKYQFFHAFAHYISGKDYLRGANVMRQMLDRYHPDQFMVLIDGWLETIAPDLSLDNTSLFLFRCLPATVLDEIVEPLEARVTAIKQVHPLTIAHFQHRLANIQFYRGDLVQSKKYFLESLDACLPTNNYGLIAFNLSMLGQVYRFMNDLDKAIHYIKQSLSYSEQHRISYSQMHSLWNLSEIYLTKNDLNMAEPLIHQALEISRHCDEASKVFPYSSMVKLLRLRGEYAQAFEWGKDALSHASRFDIEPDIGWIYMELGLTYLAAGHAEEAQFHLGKAEEKLTRQLNLYLKSEVEKLRSRNQPSVEVVEKQPRKLKLRTLGTFEIEYGGEAIKLLRKTSLRLLLFFIAHRDRKLVKDQILDQVFPDGSFQSINSQFYVSLSSLRKALEPGLQSGRQSRYLMQSGEHYTFCSQEIDLDAEQFLQTLSDQPGMPQSNRIERLLMAEQLYQGDFFEEYPYVDYLEAEREKMRLLYLNSLLELARYYWDGKDYTNGMKYYEKVLEKDPYLDHVYEEFIERLLQTQLVSSARKVSERRQRYMEQELGVSVRKLSL